MLLSSDHKTEGFNKNFIELLFGRFHSQNRLLKNEKEKIVQFEENDFCGNFIRCTIYTVLIEQFCKWEKKYRFSTVWSQHKMYLDGDSFQRKCLLCRFLIKSNALVCFVKIANKSSYLHNWIVSHKSLRSNECNYILEIITEWKESHSTHLELTPKFSILGKHLFRLWFASALVHCSIIVRLQKSRYCKLASFFPYRRRHHSMML